MKAYTQPSSGMPQDGQSTNVMNKQTKHVNFLIPPCASLTESERDDPQCIPSHWLPPCKLGEALLISGMWHRNGSWLYIMYCSISGYLLQHMYNLILEKLLFFVVASIPPESQ